MNIQILLASDTGHAGLVKQASQEDLDRLRSDRGYRKEAARQLGKAIIKAIMAMEEQINELSRQTQGVEDDSGSTGDGAGELPGDPVPGPEPASDE